MLVLGGAALFGFNASVSKVVLTAGIEPARLTALRCSGAALGLAAVLAAVAPSRFAVPRRDLPALALLGLTGAALIQWLYFVAIDRLPVGIALLLEFTGPLLVALWARLVQRQVVPRRVWLALALSLVGLAMVAQVWRDTGLDPVGVTAGLGAAACLAAFYLLGKHTLERREPLTVSFWMLTFAALFWAVAQPWWRFDAAVLGEQASLLGVFERISLPVWMALAWVVVAGTLLPYALAIAALGHLSPATTGVVAMIEPVIAAAVAWVWLGQTLGALQLAGGALVLVGVTLVQLVRSDPSDDRHRRAPIAVDAPIPDAS